MTLPELTPVIAVDPVESSAPIPCPPDPRWYHLIEESPGLADSERQARSLCGEERRWRVVLRASGVLCPDCARRRGGR